MGYPYRLLVLAFLLLAPLRLFSGCGLTIQRPLIAAFSYTPGQPQAGQEVSFDASASRGNIARYEWQFGDGSQAQGVTAKHVYAKAGAYQVLLTIRDSSGQKASASQRIQVQGGAVSPPPGGAQRQPNLSLNAPGRRPTGLAWDGKNLWVCDDLTATIYQLDAVSGAVIQDLPAPGQSPEALAWDGTHLWVAAIGRGLVQLDVDHVQVLRTLPVPGSGLATGLAWDGNELWVLELSTKRLYRISAKDASISATFDLPSPISDPQDLAWDGSHLWVVDPVAGLFEFDPQSGNLLKNVTDLPGVGGRRGIAWAGTSLWMTDNLTMHVYRFDNLQ